MIDEKGDMLLGSFAYLRTLTFLAPDGSEIDEEAAEDDLMAEENSRPGTKTTFQVRIMIMNTVGLN